MKPVVLFAPEEGREVLRTNGVLPSDWFHSFSTFLDETGAEEPDEEPSFVFWPHRFDYRIPSETGPNTAPDLAEFLGVPRAQDEETKRRHEREIVTAFLRATTVHLAILDGNEKTGTDYLKFRSCAELVAWGQAFSRSLHKRFDGEETLERRVGVLVVVVKGEQVKASQADLDAFGRMIAERAVFDACYVIDYSARLGKVGTIFHAADVWDIHVSRLLLSFVLNQEQSGSIIRDGRAIRVWQAAECELPLDATICTEAVNEALNRCARKIGGKPDPDSCASTWQGMELDAKGLQEEPAARRLLPKEDAGKWRRLSWFGGWSAFDVGALCRETCDPARWTESLKRTGDEFARWCHERFPLFAKSRSRQIFDRVHADPYVLGGQIARLEQEIGDEHDRLDDLGGSKREVVSFEREWSSLVECERQRQSVLADLTITDGSGRLVDEPESLATAVRSAQDHYVGLVYGSLALLAVVLVSGAIIRRVLFAAGGATASAAMTATLLSLSVAAGGLSMLLLTMGLQRESGNCAVRKLIKRSEEADMRMSDRDALARTLVRKARVYGYCRSRKLFLERTHALLNRVLLILRRETRSEAVSVTRDLWHEGASAVKDTDGRRLFKAATVKTFAPLKVSAHDDGLVRKVSELTEEWWGAESSPRHPTLRSLWKDLGRQYDERRIGRERFVTGHFPAVAYAVGLQNFVARFLREVVGETRRLILERCLARTVDPVFRETSVRKDLFDWCKRWHEDETVSCATATWQEMETVAFPQYVYVPWDAARAGQNRSPGPYDPESLRRDLSRNENQNGEVKVYGSKIIDRVRAFAFFYQELEVRLQSSKDGVLVFRGW